MTDYQKVAQMLEANAIHDYVDAYNKGRADAIDEFRAECESASYIPIGYGHYVTDMKSIRKIAEYLKEKNDNRTI